MELFLKRFFYNSQDTSGISKTSEFLSDFMCENIEKYGPLKVYQVITDNAYACVKAKEILSRKYDHFFVFGCTSHAIDLHLEDIGKLSFFAKVLSDAKNLTLFVKNHGIPLAIFRKYIRVKI